MAEIKCVINDIKTGKSYQKVVSDDVLTGRKIGEKVAGSIFGLTGYELQIAGGSDNAGFPMRQDIEGSLRKKIMLKKGDTGGRIKEKGVLIRKSIRGNTISNITAQVNLKIVNYGTKSVDELLGVRKEEKKEEAAEKAAAPAPAEPSAEAAKAKGK